MNCKLFQRHAKTYVSILFCDSAPRLIKASGTRNFASRGSLSEARRREIAYSQSWCCASCGILLQPDFQIDHKVPVAMGGHNGSRNLQALCLDCHKLKTQQDIGIIRQRKSLEFDTVRHVAESTSQQGASSRSESATMFPSCNDNHLLSHSLDLAIGKLNEEQRLAVLHPPPNTSNLNPCCNRNDAGGCIRVVAGPGTGKTAVLTTRVATLIERFGVPPKNILALTFTNRAALEMRSRIVDLVASPHAAEQISMGTFHAICLGLLRNNIHKVKVAQTPTVHDGEVPSDKIHVKHKGNYVEHHHINMSSNQTRHNGLVHPYERGFGVYNENESLKVIRDIMKKTLGWSADRASPAAYQALISSAKNQGISDASTYCAWHGSRKKLAIVFTMYETIMRKRNQIDFDDMLWLTVQLLKDEPNIRRQCQRQWTTILVDEFQDTNGMQFEFLRLLATPTREFLQNEGKNSTDLLPSPSSLFVVGDQNQAIYAFRGADAKNQNRLDTTFMPHVYKLSRNYRSVQGILDAAHRLISANYQTDEQIANMSDRSGPLLGLEEKSSAGQSVIVCHMDDEVEEATWIVDECLRLQEFHPRHTDKCNGGTIDSDISLPKMNDLKPLELAVLTRTNAQFQAIERQLLMEGVDHVVVNGTKFFDRREIRDVIAYMKLLHSPENNCLALERVINVPPRQIGKKTVQTLQVGAMSSGYSMWEVLCAATNFEDEEKGNQEFDSSSKYLNPLLERAAQNIPKRSLKRLRQFRDTIESLREPLLQTEGPSIELLVSHIMLAVLKSTGYDNWLRYDTPQGEDRWGNVRELVNFASSTNDLEGWLDDLALMSDPRRLMANDSESPPSLVQGRSGRPRTVPIKLMTIHASKGSEFDVVFIAGAEEDLLPHYYSVIDDEIDEERRLCYVALTRAKKRVYLTFAKTRMMMGKRKRVEPSRFLIDLDHDDVIWKHGRSL